MPESKSPAKKKTAFRKAAVKTPKPTKVEEKPKPEVKKAPEVKPAPKPAPKASTAAELFKAFSKEAAGKDGKTKAKLKVKLKEDLAALKKK